MRSLVRRELWFELGLRALLAGAVLAIPAVADGQDAHALPGGIRLVYTRAPGAEMCLDEHDFRHWVASHLPGGIDPFLPDGVWQMKVVIARRGRGFRGELALFDGDGRPRGRNVYTGATCAEVMEDVSTMASLVARPPPRPIAPAPAASAAPAASVAAATAATRAPGDGPPVHPTAAPGKPEPAREGPPRARPAPASPDSGAAARNAGAARSPVSPGSPPVQPRLMLGLGPHLGFGFLPAASVGLSGLAGVRWPASSLLVELRGDLPVSVKPVDRVSTEASWFGGSLAACRHADALFACGLATAAGVRRVDRRDNGAVRTGDATYLGLGLRVGLEVPLSSHLAGQLAGDVLLKVRTPLLSRDAQASQLGRQEAWSAPPAAAVVSLRLVASF